MPERPTATAARATLPDLAGIRSRLGCTLPISEPDAAGKVAAVAALLREGAGGVELLFIRRSRRKGDPWSGHMAWPGGKRETCDLGPVACAVRETREEIGLDLREAGELIGRLREWRPSRRGPRGLQAVFAYVFAVRDSTAVRPGPEVQEAVWIPLSYFTQWSSRRPWAWLARWLPPVPPAYRYQGRVIWGLTLWMLADLLRRLASAQGVPAASPAEPSRVGAASGPRQTT